MVVKQLENNAPRGLTNMVGRARAVCNSCGIYLRKSRWKNIIVFLSISNSWYDGFECIRCMDRSTITKDRFVSKVRRSATNPNGEIVVKRLPKFGYYCDIGNHKNCINSYIDCSCSCHNVKKPCD